MTMLSTWETLQPSSHKINLVNLALWQKHSYDPKLPSENKRWRLKMHTLSEEGTWELTELLASKKSVEVKWFSM